MKGRTSRAKLGFREEVEGEEEADRRVDERLSSNVVAVLLFVWFCGECFWTTAWELNCKPAQPVRGIVAIRSTLLPNESTKLEIGNLLTFHSENTANKEKKRKETKRKERKGKERLRPTNRHKRDLLLLLLSPLLIASSYSYFSVSF